MSRLISEILNAPEPRFTHALNAWEQMSGQSSHDLRLTSDIVQLRKKVLAELGLDVSDTTPREFFFALGHRALHTNQALAAELKITESDSSEQIIKKIITFIDTLPLQREVWTIKHSTIKQLLKKQPPKKLLKILGLRSIDSVLKRTSAYELLALAYQIESAEWTAKLHGQYKKLKPIDFQAYTSSIFMVDKPRVEKLHTGGYKTARVVVPNYETGTLLVVPPSKRFALDVLALTLALLQALYDLRVYSAYFRLVSVTSEFGSKLHTVLHKGLPGSIHDTDIGWTVLQRHFTAFPPTFESVEQPHLQYADVKLVSPLELLSEVIPEVHFWVGRGHVFMVDESTPVSAHIMDVVTNVSNQLSYEKRAHTHLQQQLWEELGLRYAQHAAVRDSVLGRIESQPL